VYVSSPIDVSKSTLHLDTGPTSFENWTHACAAMIAASSSESGNSVGTGWTKSAVEEYDEEDNGDDDFEMEEKDVVAGWVKDGV
jgi:hypothetical protein